jgi:hypothetical protein
MFLEFGGFQAMIGPSRFSLSPEMIAYSVIALAAAYVMVVAISAYGRRH